MSGATLFHLFFMARRHRRPRLVATEREHRLVRRLWVDEGLPRDQVEQQLMLHGVSSERAKQLAHANVIPVEEAIRAGRSRIRLSGWLAALVLVVGISLLAAHELTAVVVPALPWALIACVGLFLDGSRAVRKAEEVARRDDSVASGALAQ